MCCNKLFHSMARRPRPGIPKLSAPVSHLQGTPFSLLFLLSVGFLSSILHFPLLFCPLFFLSRFYFSLPTLSSLRHLLWLLTASINITVGLCVVATNAALPSLRKDIQCCSIAC